MNDLKLYMDIIVTQGQDRKPKYLEFNDMELKHRIGIFALLIRRLTLFGPV